MTRASWLVQAMLTCALFLFPCHCTIAQETTTDTSKQTAHNTPTPFPIGAPSSPAWAVTTDGPTAWTWTYTLRFTLLYRICSNRRFTICTSFMVADRRAVCILILLLFALEERAVIADCLARQ